jgi:hypothetical protein
MFGVSKRAAPESAFVLRSGCDIGSLRGKPKPLSPETDGSPLIYSNLHNYTGKIAASAQSLSEAVRHYQADTHSSSFALSGLEIGIHIPMNFMARAIIYRRPPRTRREHERAALGRGAAAGWYMLLGNLCGIVPASVMRFSLNGWEDLFCGENTRFRTTVGHFRDGSED